MNKDIFEENDRNIRVFGLETQKKLFESEVLIMNLTPMMAELCKNLILSGVGIYLFNNTSTINKIDSEKSFFFNINDVGKKKVEVFKEKIKMFKENCKVNLINDENEIIQKNIKYGVVDLSEVNFDEGKRKEIDKIMIENKGVFYYIKIENNKAIFLNNILEKKFLSDNKDSNENIFVKDEKIIEHMDLSDDESINNKVKKIDAENNNINIIEISNNNEDDVEKEKEILKEDAYSFLDLEEKIEKMKNLIPKNMKKFEELIINEAFQFINEHKELAISKRYPLNCLCNYVIGGVVCHEIINCISKKKNPRTHIYYYDAFKGFGKFLNELYDKVLK